MRQEQDPATRGKDGPQLETPRRIPVYPGSVIEAISTDGIVRITFTDNLEVDITVEKFPMNKAQIKRELSILEAPVQRYIFARLTHVGWQRVAPEAPEFAGQIAEVESKEVEEIIKRRVDRLLRKRVSHQDIKQEIKFLVSSGGGAAEPHMGYPSPVLKNIASDLEKLVETIVTARDQKKQEEIQKRRSS